MADGLRRARARARPARRRAALRDPGGDAAGDPRRRTAPPLVAPDGARGRPAAAPACTTAPTTTAPSCGIAAAYQSMEHPAADHAKAVMQVAAAGTGVRALRRLDQRPAGRRPRRGAGRLAAARPAGPPLAGARLLPGLGPAPGPAADPVRRHLRLLPRRACRGRRAGCATTWTGSAGGVLDEPATARALAAFLLRGLDCGALDDDGGRVRRPGSDRTGLEALRAAPGGARDGRRPRRPRTPGGHRGRDAVSVGVTDGRIVAVEPYDRRRAGAGRSSSTRTSCCCPVSSTRTSTSTSRAAPSGRASPPRPAPPRPAASRRSSTCRSTASRRRSTSPALRGQAGGRGGPGLVDVGFWGGAVPGNAGDLRPLHDAGVFGFKCFLLDSGVDEFPPLGRTSWRGTCGRSPRFDGPADRPRRGRRGHRPRTPQGRTGVSRLPRLASARRPRTARSPR